jgi:hypothetical protein
MNPDNTINLLKNAGLFEISHITSFECCRTAKDGNVQSLIVEIFDGGSGVDPYLRYQCEVRTKDGKKTATGNPGSTIDEVLSTLHWHDLD